MSVGMSAMDGFVPGSAYSVASVFAPEDLGECVQLTVSSQIHVALVCDLPDCYLPSWCTTSRLDVYCAVVRVVALEL